LVPQVISSCSSTCPSSSRPSSSISFPRFFLALLTRSRWVRFHSTPWRRPPLLCSRWLQVHTDFPPAAAVHSLAIPAAHPDVTQLCASRSGRCYYWALRRRWAASRRPPTWPPHARCDLLYIRISTVHSVRNPCCSSCSDMAGYGRRLLPGRHVSRAARPQPRPAHPAGTPPVFLPLWSSPQRSYVAPPSNRQRPA